MALSSARFAVAMALCSREVCNQRSYLALPYDARVNRLLNWIWDRLWRHEYLWLLFWRATPCIFQSWRCDYPPPKDLNLRVLGDVYLLAKHWAKCWGASLLLGFQAPELKIWGPPQKDLNLWVFGDVKPPKTQLRPLWRDHIFSLGEGIESSKSLSSLGLSWATRWQQILREIQPLSRRELIFSLRRDSKH